jgi:hypothetical protein
MIAAAVGSVEQLAEELVLGDESALSQPVVSVRPGEFTMEHEAGGLPREDRAAVAYCIRNDLI